MAALADGTLAFDGSGHLLYVRYTSSWKQVKAPWDGSTVASGTITTLGSTTINATTLNGTIGTAAQPNITSVGSLTALTVQASGADINISNTSESTSGLNVYDSAAPTSQFMHLDYDASANNVLCNTSGSWHFRISGTNILTFGNTDTTISNNLRLPSGNINATQAASTNYAVKAGATHASYSSEIMQSVSTRSANSSFKFLATRSSAGADLEHNLRGDGNGYCDGAWTGGGADFAEFMEWADGNPLDEDRTGRTVAVAVQDTTGHITPKIKIAEAGDVVIGAVSANPTTVGNSDWNKWQGKYLKNKYGGYLTELVDYYVWTEQRAIIPESNLEAQRRIDQIDKIEGVNSNQDLLQEKAKLISRIVPESEYKNENVEVSYLVDEVPKDVAIPANVKIESLERRVLNPAWDGTSSEDHLPRSERKEWSQIGIVGFVIIDDGQVTGDNWISFGSLGEGVSRWLLK
jgi:hypothetical protein